jgi:hypothetical protein
VLGQSVRNLLPYVTFGSQALPGILTFRLLPFVGYLALFARCSWLARSLVVALYTPIAVLAALHGSTPFYWLLLAYLYLAGAGWLAYELVPYVRSKAAWFAMVALLFWVIPAIAVHPVPRTFLVLGWDLMLAAYSYGVDTRGGPTPSWRDFSFFLLVNPALMYRRRGCRVGGPSLDFGGLARAALGVVTVFLSAGVIELARAHAAGWLAAAQSATAGVVGTLTVGALRFCREYAAQSGVASLQIGCMRQLGHRIPERYRYPLLSRSPAEFWRRWNTYVGGWAQAYVFVPLVSVVPRWSRRGRSSTRLIYAIGVVMTFALVGALHDAFVIAAERRWSASVTVWFVAMACLVLAWEAIGGSRTRKQSPGRGGGLVGRALFLIGACYAAARWPY